MTRVLITGANSFIGRNYIKHSRLGVADEVSVIGYKTGEIDFSKYNVVVHVAAIVHQSKKIPEKEYFAINKDLCLLIASDARKAGIEHFVYISSLKVYGEKMFGDELRDENSQCFPDDPYGRSKYEAELGLRELEDHKFTVSVVRTPLVYGEGVKANMLSILKLVDSFRLLPFGKIQNRRNFTYVENLVAYIDRIIEMKASGIFIVMDDGAISTTELVKYVAKYLDRDIILIGIPNFLRSIASYIFPEVYNRLFGSLEFDNSRTKSVLNYSPPFSTEEGIRRMVLSYKSTRKK